jgi:hypothetical protein
LASILQAQIIEDVTKCHGIESYPQFNIEPLLSPEDGGHYDVIPEHVLDKEAGNDLELRLQLESGDVPTVDTLFRFEFY